MANRRMFSLEIVNSDSFLSMPPTSQNLYFHLGMRADDDGVVNNPMSIKRIVGASDDDMRILIAKKFVLPIDDNGLIVIKHWKINNYIQKDRYTPSKYQEELSILGLDGNNAYKYMDTECIQNGYTGKVSIGKDSIGKYSQSSKDKDISGTKYINSTHEEIDLNKRGTIDWGAIDDECK